MTDLDLAWAAGFVDGEGSIGVYRDKAGYSLAFTVTQVDPAPLRVLRAMFGGSIRLRKEKVRVGRMTWAWTSTGAIALNALNSLLPFLVVKKDQAQVAIEYQVRRSEDGFEPLPFVERLKGLKQTVYV